MTIKVEHQRGTADVAALRGLAGGGVFLPGDDGYEQARVPWSLTVDLRPAAVAYPDNATEVAALVRAAAATGLRVAPLGTGHNAGPLAGLSGTVLLRTPRMNGVEIDPAARRARAEGGAVWSDVADRAGNPGKAHGCSASPRNCGPTAPRCSTGWASGRARTRSIWAADRAESLTCSPSGSRLAGARSGWTPTWSTLPWPGSSPHSADSPT